MLESLNTDFYLQSRLICSSIWTMQKITIYVKLPFERHWILGKERQCPLIDVKHRIHISNLLPQGNI